MSVFLASSIVLLTIKVQHTALLIPAVVPLGGAQRPVCEEELRFKLVPRLQTLLMIAYTDLLARSKVLSFCVDTLMIVNIVLPAMFSLVNVGEASVGTWKNSKMVVLDEPDYRLNVKEKHRLQRG